MNAPVPSEISVVFVEDDPQFRHHFLRLARQDPKVRVCEIVTHLSDALPLLESGRAEIAVVDLSPDEAAGADWIHHLKGHGVHVPVLAISPHDDPGHAERVLRAGARGYLTRTEAVTELHAALRSVLAGEVYLNSRLASSLLQRIMSPEEDPRIARIALLTEREMEVFRMLGSGMKMREIANHLHLGETTVQSHCMRIRRKMHFNKAAELSYHASCWAKTRDAAAAQSRAASV